MATKTIKPRYVTEPAQYEISYRGMAIENTGYIASLAAAKQYAAQRYGKGKTTIRCVYPESFTDGTSHAA